MKKLILIPFAMLALLAACDKEPVRDPNPGPVIVEVDEDVNECPRADGDPCK